MKRSNLITYNFWFSKITPSITKNDEFETFFKRCVSNNPNLILDYLESSHFLSKEQTSILVGGEGRRNMLKAFEDLLSYP